MKLFTALLVLVASLGLSAAFQMSVSPPRASSSLNTRTSARYHQQQQLCVQQRPLTQHNLGGGVGRRSLLVRNMFGDDPNAPRITRDREEEAEYFETNLDKATTAEKLKDPVLLIAFGWLFSMAIVATVFILKGVE